MQVRNIEYRQQVRLLKVKLEELPDLLDSYKTISQWAYIIHDKDISENGGLVEPHLHLYIHFKSSREIKEIASMFKEEKTGMLQKVFKWDSALLYLIHKNRPEKYQYSVANVVANFDYKKWIEDLEKRKSIIEDIEDYSMNKINMVQLYSNHSASELMYYEKEITNATKQRSRINYGKHKQVIYITGASGYGKTTLAKWIATKAYKYKEEEVYISNGSNNPLDNYDLQKVIILDDLRGDCYTKAQLFKLLDNNTNSFSKARYRDVNTTNCEMIIITSIKTPKELYNWEEEDKEPFYQLIRRLYREQFIKIDKQGYINNCKYYFGQEQNQLSALNMTKVYYDLGIEPYKQDIIEKHTIIDDWSSYAI